MPRTVLGEIAGGRGSLETPQAVVYSALPLYDLEMTTRKPA